MPIAALYDIHGNLPALEAVLQDVRAAGVDAIVVGGDVMPGPMPRECLELLASTGIRTEWIHGNGESAALEALRGGPLTQVPEAFRGGITWSANQLTEAQVRTISMWPLTTRLTIEGMGDVLFCHATARNDTELITKLSPDERIETVFAGVDAAIVVCGHTHMQFDRTVGHLRVVNAGSVGMPFGEPGAYWLLLGDDVELRMTSYDLDAAVERLKGSAFPGAADFAARIVSPPSEEQILAAYSKADGRG